MKAKEEKSENTVLSLVSASISKVSEIASGVGNLVRAQALSNEQKKTDFIERRAEERLKICLGCEHYVGNQDKKSFFDRALESMAVFRCGKCGCGLAAKVRSSNTNCPINKW